MEQILEMFSSRNTKTSYRNTMSLDQRKQEAQRIRDKYPDRIPVIVEYTFPITDNKFKFLVPNDLTMGQFCYVIRKRIKLAPEQALYFFINGKLISTSSIMGQVYKELKEECGFLFISCHQEATFGG